MKHIINAFLALCILLSAATVEAQSDLKKANKEYELNAFNLAIKSYREVLAKEPGNVVALARMADSYLQLNQIDDAIHWYEKALAFKGIDPIHIFNYAKALQAKGKYEDAKNYFLLYAEGQPVFGNHYAANCDFAISLRGIAPIYTVKNEFINGPHSEFGPAIYKDRVVFSSTRKDGGNSAESNSNWAGVATSRLFISGRDKNDFLTPPKLVKSELTNSFSEGPLSYSGDGKVVAFTKNNFVEGTRQIPSAGIELSIYLAEVTVNGDWKNARPFPFNGSGYSSGYPVLNDDGTTMYFSSDRPDGFGGFDLYVTYKVGETWTIPVNLGQHINSPGNEISPFVLGNSLFFASDWHQGLGGMDIFRAEQVDKNWSRIFHLGNGVNSSYDDYGYVFDDANNIGYFTSNRPGGKGNEDLYQLSRATDKIEITVLDGADKSPVLGASIDFSSCDEGVFLSDENGQYDFMALAGLSCEVNISKKDYESENITVVSTGKRETRRYQVLLNKISEKFVGRVFNELDNTAVEDVYVTATEPNSGRKIDAKTDANGAYRMALMPNTTYILRYSKAGFMDTHTRLSTGDGTDKSMLGVILFKPAGTSINDKIVMTEAPPAKKVEEVARTVETTDDEVSDEMIEEGYSVQIAAVELNQQVNTNSYRSLKTEGNLYSRQQNGFHKVRIGIFPTRQEADAARKQIVKKGFTQAFVVKEKMNDMVDVDFYYEPINTPASYENAVVEKEDVPADLVDTGKNEEIILEDNASKINYKVRLASYRNVKYFDKTKVEAFGKVEQHKKGSFTIMLLGGYSSLQDAISAQSKAIASGFKDAHVIIDENGRFVKVNM